jgi:RNA polymerase sigma-70 factor (ECF subfamily)
MMDAKSHADAVVDLIPQLRVYARALTRNSVDADDLVQDTLLKALRHSNQFMAGTHLRAWLFTIMRNTFFTSVKKATRERPGAADCVSGQVIVNPVHDAIIAHGELMAAIERLPPQYREMLMLVVVLGESYESAAELCKCAMGTVKSRVNRGRAMVIANLEGRTAETDRDRGLLSVE